MLLGQKIRKCKKCEIYTLMEKCSVCEKETSAVVPARFSPQDPYGMYRRMAKKG